MVNFVNPVTNMQSAGGGMKTHCISIYKTSGSNTAQSNVCLLINSESETPINTYALLRSWLTEKGFTYGATYPAQGFWYNMVITGIFVDPSLDDEDDQIQGAGYRISGGDAESNTGTIANDFNSISGATIVSDKVL